VDSRDEEVVQLRTVGVVHGRDGEGTRTGRHGGTRGRDVVPINDRSLLCEFRRVVGLEEGLAAGVKEVNGAGGIQELEGREEEDPKTDGAGGAHVAVLF